jgi:hypothetical protein
MNRNWLVPVSGAFAIRPFFASIPVFSQARFGACARTVCVIFCVHRNVVAVWRSYRTKEKNVI